MVVWNLGFVHARQADLAEQTLSHPKHVLKEIEFSLGPTGRLPSGLAWWCGRGGNHAHLCGVIVGFQVLPGLGSWCSSLLLFPTQNSSILG